MPHRGMISYGRRRNLLHQSRLAAFTKFAEDKGWQSEPIGSFYEVLRLRRPGTNVCIIYSRDRTKHLTVPKPLVPLVKEFLWGNNIPSSERD